MACFLTQGYTFTGCKTGISGLDEVLMSPFDDVVSITVTSNVVTAITMASTKQFRRYILDKEMGMDSDDLTFTPASGVITYAHKIEFTTKGITTAVKAEMKLVAQNVLIMITKRRDGTYWLYGRTKGMDLITGTSGTTKEATGFTGHVWTFSGLEPSFSLEVNSSIISDLLSPAS